ncbi:MAG TPA: extradiol ring-cleavage dioxygenase [Dehalococcoidia bacterium]|nr:extradiol ring-cleavage dioxygenase [Dehalococcoidia bacterium]
MAEIVLGLGTSHSPMLSLPGEMWGEYAARDKGNPMLLSLDDGRVVTYDELLASADPAISQRQTQEIFQAQYEACQKAITALEEAMIEADPDVVVIVGDDQEELFFDDNMPMFSIYWGETMHLTPRGIGDNASPATKASMWGYGDVEMDVPVDADLGLHLINGLIEQDFDIAHARYMNHEAGGTVGPLGYVEKPIVTAPRHQAMPHAYAYVVKRIMNNQIRPIVPVTQNTFYPPNQPSPKRCYDLGKSMANVIKDWDSDKKVAVVGSGGLSHFLVDEEIDQQALNAMKARDDAALAALPRYRLNSGSSEILNWITAAGACRHLEMDVVDYVPVYRSPAGTGGGWGFAVWR